MLKREHYAGLLMVVIGLATALGSLQYAMGTLERMGPGFFPMMLGVILALLGLWIAVAPEATVQEADPAMEETAPQAPDSAAPDTAVHGLQRHLRPWAAVVAGSALFILAGTHGGLVPATFLLIFIAALGDRKNSIRACLLLALGTTIVSTAVFYFGLNLQFPLFTWG